MARRTVNLPGWGKEYKIGGHFAPIGGKHRWRAEFSNWEEVVGFVGRCPGLRVSGDVAQAKIVNPI